jgi:hypothetical protein
MRETTLKENSLGISITTVSKVKNYPDVSDKTKSHAVLLRLIIRQTVLQ